MIETVAESAQIEMSSRELEIERIEMEDLFPMPEIDVGNVSVVYDVLDL